MEILDTQQVSEWTGVPVGTLRYWRHANEGPPSFSLGRRVVYRRDHVALWIAAQERATQRGKPVGTESRASSSDSGKGSE